MIGFNWIFKFIFEFGCNKQFGEIRFLYNKIDN